MPVTFSDEDSQPARRSLSARVQSLLGKLLLSTGHAAWVTGTSLLVLGVPLIIEMDREQQLVEMESQQLGVLSGAPAAAAPAAVAAK